MSYTDEQIYSAIRQADAAGDGEAVRRLSAHLQKSKAPAVEAPAADDPFSFPKALGRTVLNAGAGVLRGAGSIGATILTPYDLISSNTKSIGNPERRQAMTDALGTMGADTTSLAFGAGKLGGEIAGTAGIGGALANGARAVPMLAGRAAPVIDAVATAGMRAGGATGVAGLAARTAGGAITGGTAAGIVNPEDAATGALVGGALPGVAQAAGNIGGRIGQTIRGPAQSADMAAAITEARGAGYVIPPTQANPSLGNRVLEGFSGKITTAQNASAKNQAVTGRLAAEALGLPADTKLTADVLSSVRKQAGQAYAQIKGAGAITADAPYSQALDKIEQTYKTAAKDFPGLGKTNMHGKPIDEIADLVAGLRVKQFDASSAVDAMGILRETADKAFASRDKTLAKAAKAASEAMEDVVERHLQASGNAALLSDFIAARKLIAKTYTVEKALNQTTGAVDARKLAGQLAKGKPLSDELKTAAQFAARFPKAAQTVEGMGSLPQTSPLDWVPAGALSMATSNPLMMLGVGARPAARSLILSPTVQNGLLQRPSAGRGLLSNPDLVQLGYQAAPIAWTGR